MEKRTMFKVMWVNEDGSPEMNQDGFHTEDEAEEYCKDLSESFKDQEYYVTEYTHRPARRYDAGISGGVDGWEDMFNY